MKLNIFLKQLSSRLGREINISVVIAAAVVPSLIMVHDAVASSPKVPPKVSAVHFRMDHGRVYINYDLFGPSDANYKVSLTLKKASDSLYQYTPKAVSGDIGVGSFSGAGKEIVWDMNSEFPDGLPGSDYYFVVNAEQVDEGSGPGLVTMIGAGVVLVATAVTYLVISSIHSSSTQPSGLPAPPGRP